MRSRHFWNLEREASKKRETLVILILACQVHCLHLMELQSQFLVLGPELPDALRNTAAMAQPPWPKIMQFSRNKSEAKWQYEKFKMGVCVNIDICILLRSTQERSELASQFPDQDNQIITD